ncbi:hypothetical protein [Clostridium sp. DL1XJH146]
MDKILNISADFSKSYFSDSLFGKVKDRVNTIIVDKKDIKDLNVKIVFIKFPANNNINSYYRNMDRLQSKYKNFSYAPCVNRLYDYQILSSFQKKVLSYSIVRSIKLYLMKNNKSIKNAYIIINDANYDYNYAIIEELSKYNNNIILIAHKELRKIYKWRDMMIGKYGVTSIITNEDKNAFEKADFILSSSIIKNNVKCPIWYLTNSWIEDETNNIKINNVNYSTPWLENDEYTTPELLGQLIKNIDRKNFEVTLEENYIFISKIKFNNRVIEID